jgi:protein associated with RNAse G/E
MSALIRVTYRKYDGSLHWNGRLRYLGEDDYGVWLGWGSGLTMRRGYNPPVTFREPQVSLFPRNAWWTGTFHAAPNELEIYCDITTVPEWPTSDEVTMVDLDLDVIRMREGRRTFIDDEDEFLEHQVRFDYPPEVIAAARNQADTLLPEVADDAEPFQAAFRGWLSKVEHCEGDPDRAA